MAETYSKRIDDYCRQFGIDVPLGFRRRPANRFAAIDTGQQPARLVATTWFKKEDMLYHALRHPEPQTLRLLDFKERQELSIDGNRLKPTGQRF